MKLATILLQLSLLGSMSAAKAQESPPQAKKPVPQLTTDDVAPHGRIATRPSASPDDGVSGGSWARRGLNETGLSAELPPNTAAIELPFPEEIRAQAPGARAFAYTDGNWVLIAVSLVGPTPAPGPEAIVAKMMEGLERSPGVSDLSYSLQPGMKQATQVKGTFSREGIPMTLDGIVMTNRNSAWIVLGQFKSGDSDAESATSRIVSSVRVENQK